MSTSQERQDFYWKVLLKNIEWIKFSESKLIFSLTICATIVGTIGIKHKGLSELAENYPWSFSLGCLAVLLIVYSAVTAFIGLDPSLTNKNSSSLVYFGHIMKNCDNAEQYFSKSHAMLKNEESVEIQLSHQVHVTSLIAWKKFKYATYSLRSLVAAVALSLISSIIVIFS